MKFTLSGEMINVLVERTVDLEDGRETAALTAAAMVVNEGEGGRNREKLYWLYIWDGRNVQVNEE